jgi:hypothetical protein
VRDHLRLIGTAYADLFAGRIRRLLIITPPQVGKSTTAGEWGPFWWLCRRPASRVVVCSYGKDLALVRGRHTRELVAEHGHRYGLRLNPATRAAHDWSLLTGGGMRSVGIESGLTGHSGDLMIIDDPHKDRAEADSKRIRDAVYSWYSSTVLSRGSPGMPLVLILTRWHPDDLAGRVLKLEGREGEGGRWRVLHMPALATAADPLGRAVGDPLPHPKIPPADVAAAAEHWREKRATAMVRDWAALYQGDPKPAEGALLTYDILNSRRDYTTTVERVKVGVAVDPSGGGRDVAGIVAGFLGDDGRLYWTHDHSDVGSSDWWARTACELAARVDADRIVVESNYGGDMAALVLKTAWKTLAREHPEDARYQRLPPRVVMAFSRRGKVLRAEPVAQQVIEDRVRLGAYLPELEEEWATWQPGKESPGRIDASVHLTYELLPIPGAAGMVSTATSVSRQATAADPRRQNPQSRGKRPY